MGLWESRWQAGWCMLQTGRPACQLLAPLVAATINAPCFLCNCILLLCQASGCFKRIRELQEELLEAQCALATEQAFTKILEGTGNGVPLE